MKGIKILGTGLCRGDSRISNFDLTERIEVEIGRASCRERV